MIDTTPVVARRGIADGCIFFNVKPEGETEKAFLILGTWFPKSNVSRGHEIDPEMNGMDFSCWIIDQKIKNGDLPAGMQSALDYMMESSEKFWRSLPAGDLREIARETEYAGPDPDDLDDDPGHLEPTERADRARGEMERRGIDL